MSDELPQGWATTTLGEICSKPQYGWTCKASRQGKVKYVRTTDISDGRIDWDTVPFCEEVPDDIEKYRVRADDILVSRAGSVGVSFRIADVPCDAVFASYLIRFKPIDGIPPKCIELFLKPDAYWRSISDFSVGIAVPNVNASKLASLEMPLAPPAELRRIVAKLTELLGKVDACQQRLAKIPVLLKRFRQSVLAAACSGRLTADWREERTTDDTDDTDENQSVKFVVNNSASLLLDEIKERRKELWAAQRKAKELAANSAGYPKPAKSSDEFESDVPESWERGSMDALTSVITSGSRDWKQYCRDDGSGTFIMAQNVRPLRFDRSYRLAVAPPENDRDRARSEVFKDDLLVTIAGANTADCCRVPEKLREHYVCQSVALMRPALSATSRFLELFLNSTGHGLAEWRKWIYGEGRPHLNFDNLRETLVCLPPLAEQQEIVRRVEGLFPLADQIETRFQKAQAQVDKLTPSLLARAFAGKLVPQNPTDESTENLLRRIGRRRTLSHD